MEESQLEEIKKKLEEDGYVVIPNFFALPEGDRLKQRINQLVSEYFQSEESNQKSIFTSINQAEKMSDDYFISSGDKIRFFYEEDAFDSKGKLKTKPLQSINKVGHALFDLDPVFHSFTKQSKISQLAKYLLKDPVIAQSMYIFKQPRIGGKVRIHQDSTFINTKPLSCVAFWFALEDVTLDNGCLWVIPGSHKEGIAARFTRNEEGTAIHMGEAEGEEKAPWTLDDWSVEKVPEKWVALPCPAGSLVIIHGSVIHFSNQNTTQESRQVYTFHMVDRNCTYSPRNWLQRPPEMPFAGFE